jgi:hypothetical protein
MALYGAETWTLRAADQKYLESFEMWVLILKIKRPEVRNTCCDVSARPIAFTAWTRATLLQANPDTAPDFRPQRFT